MNEARWIQCEGIRSRCKGYLGRIYMYNIDTRACVVASHPHFANNWR